MGGGAVGGYGSSGIIIINFHEMCGDDVKRWRWNNCGVTMCLWSQRDGTKKLLNVGDSEEEVM